MLQNIIGYLGRVGSAGDPEALQLLEETEDHLKAQAQIDSDEDNNKAETPSELKDTLKPSSCR